MEITNKKRIMRLSLNRNEKPDKSKPETPDSLLLQPPPPGMQTSNRQKEK